MHITDIIECQKDWRGSWSVSLIDNAKIVGFGVGDIDFCGGVVADGGSRRV